MRTTPVTWLYTPGDRPERFGAAARFGADVAIWDLEDAVPESRKAMARANVIAALDQAAPGSVEIRVNALDSPWAADDLRAITDHPALRAVRVPKVDGPEVVEQALGLMSATHVPMMCLLETARAIEAAHAIAVASPRVIGLALGEADLAADLGVGDEVGLVYARSRAVVAARAAGLAAPVMGASPSFDDPAEVEESTRRGRVLGLFGRAAIHPSQLAPIRRAFAPTDDEVERARRVVAAVKDGESVGVVDGVMVDPAVVAGARQMLDRAQGLPSRSV